MVIETVNDIKMIKISRSLSHSLIPGILAQCRAQQSIVWSLWYPPLLISRIFLPWNYSNRSVLLLPWRNGYESGRKPSQNHCYYYKLTNSEISIVVSSEWVQTGSEHQAVRCAGWPSHSCLAWPGHMTYPDQSEAGPTKRPIRSQ